MKNLIIISGVILLTILGCKDDDSEPGSSIKMEDLLGIWVSVDSAIFQNSDGKYVYSQDTLMFKDDTLLSLYNPYAILSNSNQLGGFYSLKLIGGDSLYFNYRGPTYINLSPNIFKMKIYFNSSKDTIFIDDMRKTYPYRNFNKFSKI